MSTSSEVTVRRWPRRSAYALQVAVLATGVASAMVGSALDGGRVAQAANCVVESYGVGARPVAVAVADVNGDDYPDMATADKNADTVSVRLNDGRGGFGKAASYSVSLDSALGVEPAAVAIADVTGDGVVDMAVANTNHHSVAVLQGQGNGSFGEPVEFSTVDGVQNVPVAGDDTGGGRLPVDVVAVDLDGDGSRDLATANRGSGDVSVLLNSGAPSVAGPFFAQPMTAQVGDAAEGLTAARLDGGDMDLAVATDPDREDFVDVATELVVLSGSDPLGKATTHSVGATSGVVAADVNTDSRRDLVTSSQVLVNPGTGFDDPTHVSLGDFHAEVVAVGDVTGDGNRDVATASDVTDKLTVLAGQGDATFTRAAACAVGNDPAGVAAGDVDGDGRAELLTVNAAADTVSVVDVQTSTTGELVGSVTGADTGENLADANITVTDSDGNRVDSTRTNATGEYALKGLAPGQYTVAAVHPGYQADSQEVSLAAQETATVDFSLVPHSHTGGIRGTITSRASSESLADAEITVRDVGGTIVASTTTNAAGEYALDGLVPGQYTVAGDHPYYETASQQAAVQAGETATVDLALHPADGALAGRVTAVETGKALAGVEVSLAGRFRETVVTGSAGRFRFEGVEPGDYIAAADTATHRLQSAKVTVEAGRTATADFALTDEAVGCSQTAYDVGDRPVAVATADFDGDGQLDAATANRDAGTVSVLLGDGEGQFTAATTEPVTLQPRAHHAVGVVAADLNADDTPDLAVASFTGAVDPPTSLGAQHAVVVLFGRGDGTFAEPVEYPLGVNVAIAAPGGQRPVDLVAADLDGDGDQDLATVNAASDDVAVLVNAGGAGVFTGPRTFATGGAGQALTAGQLNSDGNPDLAVATAASELAVLAGNGDATFQKPVIHAVGTNPRDVVAADLDGDADQDLTTVNAASDDVAVLVNTEGGFAEPSRHPVGPATEPSALTIADVDGDGYRDLATTTDISEVALLANDSETAFTRVADCPTVGVTSRAVTMVDVDGDAHPDVLATNTNDGSLSVGRITGRLVGTVTNAVSGQAVADTAIRVIDEQGKTVATANTGSDGSYALGNLPAHDYTVKADHPEYQSASGKATVRGTETTAVDLALEPTATGAITGEVTDAATGQTIGGVELTVTTSDGSQVASATTAGDGTYRVADLDTSIYTVTANDADYQSASKQTTVTHGDIATLDFALTPATKDDESDGDNIDGTDGGGDNGHSGGDGSGGRSDRSGEGVSNDSDSSAGGDGGAGDDGADGGADGGGADNGGSGGAHEGGSGDGGFGGDGEGGSEGDGGGADGGGADGGGAARRGDAGGDSERAPLGVQAGVARVAGRDRFATAARLSEQAYPEGAEVAYVATGLGFADALTGGVAAGRAPGPVLLVSGAGVPAVTAGELQRLDPDRLVIVGGRGAVDASVASTLAGYADRVERLAGANRFATARAVAQTAFPRPGAVDTVYVASGQTFADALAGGPAAVQAGAPLLLAGRDELPPATRAALQRFGPRRVVLLGGPTALSETVVQAAAGFADTVQRLAGPTRFATAAAIARQRFGGGVDEVMVATGTGFADALAGGAVAGARGVPLLLAAPEGLTAPTRSAVARLAPATGRLLGGPAALSDRVHGQLRQALPGDGGGG